MPRYRYFEIKDGLHQKCVVAGYLYDGKVYHQDAQERSNARWKLVDAGDGFYHLIDHGHGKALVAGDTYDGKVYHQNPDGRPNAAWTLRPVGTPGAYTIVDRKHGKALVAGDTYDGKVYHQDPDGRPNATWGLTLKSRGDLGPAVEVQEERIVTPPSDDWLGRLPDHRPIFDINLPGTHDSAAINTTVRTLYACQDKTIADQLRLGVRFLDVRLRIDQDENRFEISTCHGYLLSGVNANKYQSFASLWSECNEFLVNHPTEFIAMTLKVDDWSNVTGQANRAAALNALGQEMRSGSSVGYVTIPYAPRLDEVRGQIYLLNRINDEPRFGPAISWKDNETGALIPATQQRLFELYVQDNYNDPDDKVKLEHFIAALHQKRPGRLVINYASATKTGAADVKEITGNTTGPVADALRIAGAVLSKLPAVFGVYINSELLQYFAKQPADQRPQQLGWALFDYAQMDHDIEGFPLRNCIDLYVASNFGYVLPY